MIQLQQIKEFTENYFECEDLRTKSRKQDFIFAKNMAFYLARKYTDATTTQIGKEIADKDHATVLHSLRKVDRYLKAKTIKGNLMYPEQFDRIVKCESVFYANLSEIIDENKIYKKFNDIVKFMNNNNLRQESIEFENFLDDFLKHLSN
jgi:hypothetical protein